MVKGIRLRYLSFHGPVKQPATIGFSAGLNVIYGASNTGKSFIVDTIDFMLGGKGPLRDIPERIGYDRILLAIETLSDEKFTIMRSVDGGAFRVFDGLYSDILPEGEGSVLAEQHNERKEDNLSTFLLSKVDLVHKRIRKNKRNDTNSLSFRNVARLLIINEEEIIQQRSPLSDGNPIADTPNTSTFKLLLSGVDDSALTTMQPRTPEEQTRGAQLELLEQLIEDYQKQVRELAGREDLEDQIDRLSKNMASQSPQLTQAEAAYREVFTQRRDLTKKIEEGLNRLAEITALLDRFTLLGTHYRSDIERLRGIEEAGSLFGALAKVQCPLCGAASEHHKSSGECDGNIPLVVFAAQAEIAKIEIRQRELQQTIKTLRKEAINFERRLPDLQSSLGEVSGKINGIFSPNLRQLRASYKQLADKSGEVREALAIHRGLRDFQDRKMKLESEYDEVNTDSKGTDIDLSTTLVDRFATLVLKILKAWHFPHIDRVSFDLKIRDLIVNGKNRISFGKGLRAITQAAFTIGLLEYCRENQTTHPGFVVLDSPLLSYREPENAADDLRGTDLNNHFYDYLASEKEDKQIIIVENTDPPPGISTSAHVIKFTGVENVGRYGYFPR